MTRGKAIPPSEGLLLGYMAAMEAAAKQKNPIGPDYAEMLQKGIVSDSVPNSSCAQGTLMELPQIQGVSQDPLPLSTYERYNMSIDPKMFITNTRPINQDEYSIVNQALAPLPASPVSANPRTVEQFKGGAIATSGRGVKFMAERIPTEIKNTDYDPATVLDQVTNVKQMLITSQSMKNSKKQYAKGLKNFGQRYGLDPASVFGGESEHVTQAAQGQEVPVVTSSGKAIGTLRVPDQSDQSHHSDQSHRDDPSHQSDVAFGYAIESRPDQSLVPLVRVANYDGLQSYIDSQVSGQTPDKKDGNPELRRKMRRDLNPFQYYADAWTNSDRTPLQTALIVATILVALAVLALIIWALVALARPRRLVFAKAAPYREPFNYKKKPALEPSPMMTGKNAVPEASWMRRN